MALSNWQRFKADRGINTGIQESEEERQYKRDLARQRYEEYGRDVMLNNRSNGILNQTPEVTPEVEDNAAYRNYMRSQELSPTQVMGVVEGTNTPLSLKAAEERLGNIDPKYRGLFYAAASKDDGGLKGLANKTRLMEQTGMDEDSVARLYEDTQKMQEWGQSVKDGTSRKKLSPDQALVYAKIQHDNLPDDVKAVMEDYREKYSKELQTRGRLGNTLGALMRNNSDIDAFTLMTKYGIPEDKVNEYIEYEQWIAEDEAQKERDAKVQINENDNKVQKAAKYVDNSVKAMTDPVLGGFNAVAGRFDARNSVLGYNPNSYYSAGLNEASAAQNAVGSNINSKLGRWAYDTAIGIGRTAATIGTGALTGGGELFTLASMSSGSYADTYKDARERGLSVEDADKLGVTAAAVETLTEKISLDHAYDIFKANKIGGVNFLIDSAAQSGIEMSEEIASEILNEFAESQIIDGTGLSQRDMVIREAMANGASREEAEKAATKDFAKRIVEAGIGGAISGLAIGAGSHHISSVMANESRKARASMYEQQAAENEGKTRSDQIAKEQAEKYAKNPVRAQVDMMHDSSEIGRQRKAKAMELAETYEKNGKLSAKENYELQNLLAEDEEANYPGYHNNSNVTNGINEDEFRTGVVEAINNGDADALNDLYDKASGSSSEYLRENLDSIMDEYKGKAENAGISAEEFEAAKVTTQDAYNAGYSNTEIGKLNARQEEARNEGIKARIEERANEVNAKAETYDENTAKVFKSNLNDTLSVEQNQNAFDLIMNKAQTGLSLESIMKDPSAIALGEERVKNIRNYGMTQYNNALNNERAKILAEQKYIEKGTGKFEDARTTFNDDVDTNLFSTMAKAFSLNFKLTDPTTSGTRASFNPGTSTITVSADNVGQIFHELTGEFTEFYNSEGYEKLRKAVLEFTKDDVGERAFSLMLDSYHDSYLSDKQTKYDSSTEFANDMIAAIMQRPESQKKFAEYLAHKYGATEARTLGQKIRDIFKSMLDALKSIINNSGMNDYQKRIYRSKMEEADRLANQIILAFDEALNNYENLTAENTEVKAEAKAETEAEVKAEAEAKTEVPGKLDPKTFELDKSQSITDSDEDFYERMAAMVAEATGAEYDTVLKGYKDYVNNPGDGMRFSIKTYDDGGRIALEVYVNDQVKSGNLTQTEADDILDRMDWGYKLAKDLMNKKELVSFGNWSQTGLSVAPDGTPYLTMYNSDGRPIKSVVVNNGEYPLNIDFTQVCKKRVALNNVLNKLVADADLNINVLTESDINDINSLIKEHGFEIACGLCFVDSKRYRVGEWANSFAEGKLDKNGRKTQRGWNDIIKSILPKGVNADYFNFSSNNEAPLGTLLSELSDDQINWSKIDAALKPYLKEDGSLGAKKTASGKTSNPTERIRMMYLIRNNPNVRHFLDKNDLIASEGLDAMREQNYDLYKLVNAHWGAGKPKLPHGYTAYGNDILRSGKSEALGYEGWGNKNDFNPKNSWKVGGVRVQSFSDFVANMFFDYMQMFADMSARKLPSHAYTKEVDYVKMFGLTGQKINMSLVPRAAMLTPEQQARYEKLGKRGVKAILNDPEFQALADHAGLDEKGNYIWEDETFPFKEAMKLRSQEGYKDNCGTIAVGVSDAHIRKLLADPNIDMVIPYHSSGVSQLIKKARNIALYTDYQSVQNTRNEKGDAMKNDGFDWYGQLKSENNPDGLEAKEVAANYLKYCEEKGYTPKFDAFKDDPNYYKLLTDFRMYDENGNFQQQNAVRANYPKNLKSIALKALQAQQLTEDKMDIELSDEQNSLYTAVKERLAEKGTLTVPEVRQSRVVDTSNIKAENVEEALETSDVEVRYSRRVEAPPKNTIKAYKVFVAFEKDPGHLYPPVVASPGGAATPVGVWINADTGEIARNKDGSIVVNTKGRMQVKQGGKDTNKSGGGSLAWRPGWHLGEVPDAKQFAGKNDNMLPGHFVYAECEIAADNDYQLEAMEYGVNEKGNFVRSQAGLPYIPADGYYKYRTNPDPNTVPWFITGAMKVTRILDDNDVRRICAEHGVVPLERRGGDIDLSKFGLKAGEVTPTEDLSDLPEHVDYSDEIKKLPGYVRRALNFDDPKVVSEFGINKLDIEKYKEGYSAPQVRESRTIYMAESDLNDYASAGGRKKQSKFRLLKEGKLEYISSREELNNFVTDSIEGNILGKKTIPYAKVTDEFNDELVNYSGGKFNAKGMFWALSSDDVRHSYNKHKNPVLPINLSMSIPQMVDAFDRINESVVVDDDLRNGRRSYTTALPSDDGVMIFIDVHSMGYGTLTFKTAYRLKADAFKTKYKNIPGIVAILSKVSVDLKNPTYPTNVLNRSVTVGEEYVNDSPDIRFSKEVDTDGVPLNENKQRFFAKSQMRDDSGKLKVMYHGARSAGFTVFNSEYSDDGTSLFFTDEPIVAKSYSGTHDLFEPDKPMTYKELETFMSNLGGEYYLQKDGDQVNVLEVGFVGEDDEVLYTGDLKGAQDFILGKLDDIGGDIDLNYKVYLNIENPFVMDAEGASWDELPGEYKTTRELSAWAKEEGYDGVIIKNVYDNGLYASRSEYVASTVAVAFDGNQVKSVYNNNPTDNPDIRYSNDIDDVLKDILEEENPTVNESILDQGLKALKGKTIDQKIVRGIASEIRAEHKSSINMDELSDMLSRAFAYIHNQGNVKFNDVLSIFEEVAKPIMDNANEKIGVEEYKEFTDFFKDKKIKLSDTQMAEVKSKYGSYPNFQRAMYPLQFSTNGTYSLDSMWSTLVGKYSEILDYVSEGEMPLALNDALNSVKPQMYNTFGADSEEAGKDIAMEIVQKYFEAQSDARVKKAAENLKAAEKQYRADVRKRYQERYDEAKKKLSRSAAFDEYNKKLLDMKARSKDRMTSYKDRQNAKAQKKQIAKIVKDIITRITNPTENKHVPSKLAEPLAQFIQCLDFVEPEVRYDKKSGEYYIIDYTKKVDGHYGRITGSTSTEALENFYDNLNNGKGSRNQLSWYSSMMELQKLFNQSANLEENLGDVINLLDATMGDQLNDLLDRNKYVINVKNLNTNDLITIKNALKNIAHAINLQNKAFTMKEEIPIIAHGIQNTAEQLKTKDHTWLRNKLHTIAVMNMMTPETYFTLLGKEGRGIYTSFERAFEKKIGYVHQTEKFMSELLGDTKARDIRSWRNDIKTIPTSEGNIKMSVAHIMTLYELSKRNQAMLHMPGGIEVEKIVEGINRLEINQNKGIHLSPSELSAIFSTLTDEQKRIADGMQQYMANECGSWGNEASLLMYDFEKFLDPNYFPITTDSDTNKSTDTEGNLQLLNGIERMGFTKAVNKNANNPIVIKDIFSVFTEHSTNMAAYASYAPVIKDALRVYNYKDVENDGDNKNFIPVKKALNECMGRTDSAGKQYFDKFIRDINGNERVDKIKDKGEWIVGNFKAAAVGANVRVVVQQPTAYIRAASIIKPQYLIAATPKAFIHDMEKLKDSNELIYWKSQGYYESSMGKNIENIVLGTDSARDRLIEASMWLAGKADDMTWACLYNACERQVKAENNNLSDEEMKNKVNELFSEVIHQTQVVDSTLMKSPWQRSKDGKDNMMNAFMAEPIKSYNMALKSLIQLSRKEISPKQAMGVLGALLATDMVNALAQAFVDAIRHRDDDDEYLEQVLNYWVQNLAENVIPFNRIPFVKDVFDQLWKSIKGENTYGSSSGQLYEYAALESFSNALLSWKKKFDGTYNKTNYAFYMDNAKALSQIIGIPIYNFSRDAVALWNMFSDDKLVMTSEKPMDKYNIAISALDKERSDEYLNEAVKKIMEEDGTLKKFESKLVSEYKQDYLDALENDDRISDELFEKAVRGYMAMGLSRTDAESEVESWTDVKIGYSDMDKSIESGDGIDLATKIVMENKEVDKILDHIYNSYGATIEFNRAKGYNSSIEENVNRALNQVAGMDYDGLVQYIENKEAEKEAKAIKAAENKAAAEAKAEIKKGITDTVSLGTDYKKAVSDAVKSGMDYSDIKSALTSEYKEQVVNAYKSGNRSSVTSTINRIVTVKAYCDRQAGLKIAKKYNGDYEAYERDHLMEWFK